MVNKSKYAYMAYTKQEQIPFQKKRRGFKNKTHAALKQGIKTLFKLRPQPIWQEEKVLCLDSGKKGRFYSMKCQNTS